MFMVAGATDSCRNWTRCQLHKQLSPGCSVARYSISSGENTTGFICRIGVSGYTGLCHLGGGNLCLVLHEDQRGMTIQPLKVTTFLTAWLINRAVYPPRNELRYFRSFRAGGRLSCSEAILVLWWRYTTNSESHAKQEGVSCVMSRSVELGRALNTAHTVHFTNDLLDWHLNAPDLVSDAEDICGSLRPGAGISSTGSGVVFDAEPWPRVAAVCRRLGVLLIDRVGWWQCCTKKAEASRRTGTLDVREGCLACACCSDWLW